MSATFNSAASRWGKFGDRSGPALANLKNIATTVSDSTTFDDEEKRAHLLDLQKAVHAIVHLETFALKRKEACESVSTLHSHSQDDQTQADDFAAECTSLLAAADRAANRTDAKRAAHSKDIAELIKGLDGGEDEELVVEGGHTRSNAKCPILSTPMQHPMKNSECGHVYSLQGALLLLAQAHGSGSNFRKLADAPAAMKCRCPIAGCNKSFGPTTLARDYAAELSQRQQTMRASAEDGEEVDMLDV